MTIRRLTIPVVAAAIVALTIAPGYAAVPITQTATLTGQQPVSGTYDRTYTNYGERVCENPRGCSITYVKVSRGVLKTKLNSYRLRESMKKYDFYLLDVDTTVTGKSGASVLGSARFDVTSSTAKVVDLTDSKSIDKDPQKCQSFPVTVGAGFYGVSGGVEVGAVRYCDKTASFLLKRSGNTATYTANRLPKINLLDSARLLKVKAGTKPSFKVVLTYPTDVCTHRNSNGRCDRFRDGTAQSTYRVGTNG